ncbi:MAG: TIGR04086 family membrane protein [Clostridia bacterium]|nr:TIGR04086 family membrane protein [Clostridia bacterium]
MDKTLSQNSKGFNILIMTKGVFWAISCSLLCILIFAFIIKFTAIPESVISPINQIIKVFSILMGCWVASRKIEHNGWFWGMILGACYTLLAFLVFSILDGEFHFSLNLLNDLVFGSILGLISGIIAFAIRK